jgi:hypothetical protein
MLVDREEMDFIRQLSSEVLVLFLKLRAEYPDLISTLGLLIDSIGFTFMVPDIFSVLRKL